MRPFLLLFFILLCNPSIPLAQNFRCAGTLAREQLGMDPAGASKPAQLRIEGTRNAIVLFAQFLDEEPGWVQVPEWSEDIFDPEKPGSLTHFYHAMSFGLLRIAGEVAPRYYVSSQNTAAYLADAPDTLGHFGRFVFDILKQADREINFAHFDNDGPDGRPNSGDDDGLVDLAFINLLSAPKDFLFHQATGIAMLGLEAPYVTRDVGFLGEPIRIPSSHGTIQKTLTFSEAVGVMSHECGHLLGLPDLYNTSFLSQAKALPQEDSAGIGRWGLMGWGAMGWNGDDGPGSFSAWSLERLGWVAPEREQLIELKRDAIVEIRDIFRGGAIYKIPLRTVEASIGAAEYLLLEQRTRTFYNRNIPAEGLLVWHIKAGSEWGSRVDLVCADGLFLDAGYPLGLLPDRRKGSDNLDFWAHEKAYAQAHEGNLGDATDPFDGVGFTRLDLGSNPSNNPWGLTPSASTGVELEMQPTGQAMQVEVRQPRWAGLIDGELTWEDEIIVDGDVEIAPEGKLTLNRIVQIRFVHGDRLQLGLDPNLSELVVRGDFLLVGRAAFSGFEPTSAWYGIVFKPAGSSHIRFSKNRYEIGGATHGLLFPGSPRGIPEESLSSVIRLGNENNPNIAGGEDQTLHPGETYRLVLELSNWSLNFFDVERVWISWDGTVVHSQRQGNSHDFELDSSLRIYPGQTLRFSLPPLTVDPGLPPGGTIDFILGVSTFPKPDYKNRITLLVEEEFPVSELTTAVEYRKKEGQPIGFSLLPNYPNPFNQNTLIRFSLPTGGEIELAIFNLTGQKVKTLIDGQREAGHHVAHWDGLDDQRREMASGVYFCRLRTENGLLGETRKLLLAR
jgi:M6 family metalloprotease-like protein